MVTAALEFTIAEESKISASFLRVDVRDGVVLKIFNNYDLLPWYICCFFVKHSGRLVISILKTSAQREGWNNAATLNLLKSDSLRVCVFFESVFVVDFAGVTKLFFLVVSKISLMHLISCLSTNSLYYIWPIPITVVSSFLNIALCVELSP